MGPLAQVSLASCPGHPRWMEQMLEGENVRIYGFKWKNKDGTSWDRTCAMSGFDAKSPVEWELPAFQPSSTNISQASTWAKHFMGMYLASWGKIKTVEAFWSQKKKGKGERDKAVGKDWNLELGKWGELSLGWVATVRNDCSVRFPRVSMESPAGSMILWLLGAEVSVALGRGWVCPGVRLPEVTSQI